LTNFPEFSCSWEQKKWDEAVRGSFVKDDDPGQKKGIKYRHYCIEASYETFERVHAAAEKMKLADVGLTVHYNAVSSSSWPSTVKFPKITAGQENIGIGMTANPNLKTQTYSEFHQTPVITVDEFVRKENMLEGLDVVKIDTEGNDAAVLIGASKTLMSLKPSYVQFENHGVGKWKTFDLKDSIDMLDAMEYECFWSTNSGKLIQATNCWHESYSKFKIWSNIACYHRSDRTLKRIMDKYVVAN
jgi:FkbM family methyltransferase